VIAACTTLDHTVNQIRLRLACGFRAALSRAGRAEPQDGRGGPQKNGAPDTHALLASKNYLTDFGRLLEEGKSKQDIYDEMTTLYPDWVSHQSWLMFNCPAIQSSDR
jgi:hypothetical protein